MKTPAWIERVKSVFGFESEKLENDRVSMLVFRNLASNLILKAKDE